MHNPPEGYWICESEEIQDLWAYQIDFGKQPDNCKKHLPHMVVDLTRLAHDLPPNQSALFVDKGELVMLVVHNFCNQPDVVQTIDVVFTSVQAKKSVQVCLFFL